MIPQQAGQIVRTNREKNRLSIRKLAHAVGVTPSYIHDIENARRRPSRDLVIRIANQLQLNYDWLAEEFCIVGGAAEALLQERPDFVRQVNVLAEKYLRESNA